MNQKLKSELEKLAKKFNLDLLVLFGSRAKGINNINSDWDFAFIKYGNFTYEDEFNLNLELIKIIQNEKIDLVNIMKTQKPKLNYEIFNYGYLIFEKKKNNFDNLKSLSVIDYIDSKRFFKQKEDMLKRELILN